jgi:hypothetical protein
MRQNLRNNATIVQSRGTLGYLGIIRLGGGARRLFRRRDPERDPRIPAVGPILVGEFPVAFEIEVTLGRGVAAPCDSASPLARYLAPGSVKSILAYASAE